MAQCTNVTVSAASNCVATASIDNGSFDPDGNTITLVQVPPGPYPIGSNNVCLVVTDSLGVSNVCCGVVMVVDTTPPTLYCPGNIVATNDPGQCSAVVNFAVTATDCAIADLFADIPSGSVFPSGITTVTATAVDVAGNTNTCSFTVTVLDNQPPTATCVPAPNPSNPKRNSKSGQSPSGFYQLFATDNCDPNPEVFVADTASSFIAGPYKSGAIVQITQNPGGTPSIVPGKPPVVAKIQLKGDGLVYAVDGSGNVGVGTLCHVPPPPK